MQLPGMVDQLHRFRLNLTWDPVSDTYGCSVEVLTEDRTTGGWSLESLVTTGSPLMPETYLTQARDWYNRCMAEAEAARARGNYPPFP